ncbi:MAG TPA: hypothetical protein DEQ38_02835 [Elusimicrobia bacterium]|nr:hypothetical protein [Elusimicrobiota bacterium]
MRLKPVLFLVLILAAAAAAAGYWYLQREKSGFPQPIAVNPYFPMPKFEEVKTIDLEKESARFADFFATPSTSAVAPATSSF